ncbi:MAG TPA: hypothetical protein DCE65_08675 [Clostridiales bacterium]|nr:hypothetical protein [Clostridiales bacterium]
MLPPLRKTENGRRKFFVEKKFFMEIPPFFPRQSNGGKDMKKRCFFTKNQENCVNFNEKNCFLLAKFLYMWYYIIERKTDRRQGDPGRRQDDRKIERRV